MLAVSFYSYRLLLFGLSALNDILSLSPIIQEVIDPGRLRGRDSLGKEEAVTRYVK